MAPRLRDHWDLLLAAGVAVATGAVVALRPESPLRPVLGLLLVGVVPGWAVVAALFPDRPPRWPSSDPGGSDGDEPDSSEVEAGRGAPMPLAERVVVSVGTSVALVALLGIGLGAAGLGIRLRWILSILPAVTLAGCAAAAWRRGRGPLPDTGST
jgi:uncharacterized membrane protein